MSTMESKSSQRVFNKKEISTILEKAARASAGNTSPSDEGLTESELIQLARDSGINEEAIKDAIHSEEKPVIGSTFESFNKNSRIVETIAIPGSLDLEGWDEIVHALQSTTGFIGTVRKDESSYTWIQGIKLSVISITAGNKAGKINVEASSSSFGIKLLLNMATLITSMMGMFAFGAFGTGVLSTSILFGLMAGVITWYVLHKIVLKSFFGKQKKRLESLIESVSKVLRKKNTSQITIEEEHERLSDNSTLSDSSIVTPSGRA